MKIDTTQILAIYGALISSILLFLRFKDRTDKKRKMLVRIDKFIKMNKDTYNYHDGRKGNQFIRIRITNQSENSNSIEKIELNSISKFWRIGFNVNKISLTFDHNLELPIHLDYSNLATGYIFIHMNPHEFNQSLKSNYETLKEIRQKYIFVKGTDTQGKNYKSNCINIKTMLKEFLDVEKDVTTEKYYEEKYNETGS